MANPKAVVKQAEEADLALDQLLLGNEAPGEKPGETAAEASSVEEGQPIPVETPGNEEIPAIELAAAESAAPAPVTVDVDQLQRQLDYEKHRNDSLQGRLDSQLRPLNDTVRDLRSHISDLESRLEKRETDTKNAVPAHLRHLSPGELENLDKDSVELQSRVARGVVEDALSTSERDSTERLQQVDQRIVALEAQKQAQTTSDFWGKVEKVVPGANTVNDSDPRWGTFLDTVDPLSGRSRREIGEVALSIGDVKRVAYLMQDFNKDVAGVAPAAPGPAPVVRRPEPVRATPAAPAATAAPVIRHSQIRRFYDDLARGKFRGKEEQADRLEAAIINAVEDGRVLDS